MRHYAITGLARIDLPETTVRLCDGAIIRWGSDKYRAKDDLLGRIGSIESLEEGVGDMVPALQLTFLPPGTAAAADLSQPGWQTSRARFWVADYDPDTGDVIGTPDRLFDGYLDQTQLIVGKNKRELHCSVVSWQEQFFEQNTGNDLSPSFHRSVWPGEGGEDEATGITLSVAWGVVSPS